MKKLRDIAEAKYVKQGKYVRRVKTKSSEDRSIGDYYDRRDDERKTVKESRTSNRLKTLQARYEFEKKMADERSKSSYRETGRSSPRGTEDLSLQNAAYALQQYKDSVANAAKKRKARRAEPYLPFGKNQLPHKGKKA